DITPLLADPTAFGQVIAALAAVSPDVDLVAGIEARGFLLAGAVARELDCGLVPVRKAGKLPPPTVRREYVLEYGTAAVEVPVHRGASAAAPPPGSRGAPLTSDAPTPAPPRTPARAAARPAAAAGAAPAATPQAEVSPAPPATKPATPAPTPTRPATPPGAQ